MRFVENRYLRRMKFSLVTGGSSGIGLEYVRQLAACGHNVIIVSNRREDNESAACAVRREYGVAALPLYADLSDAGSADMIYDWCRAHDAEVDILISNAGILHFGKLANASPAAIDRITAIHCTTPVKLCRLFAADMCRRREGRILLMSSITAWTPYPTMSLYGSTKAFLRNFGQSLWYELRDCGVSVTTVFPGAVDTPLYNLDAKVRRRLRKIGVMMSAEDLARRGLRAMFEGRRRCIPGMVTRTALFICRILPAHALIPLLRVPAVARLLDRL